MVRPQLFFSNLDSLFSLPTLEHQLVVYISTEKFARPFALSSIPIITNEESDTQALPALAKRASGPTSVAEQPKASAQSMPNESASQNYANALGEVPELKEFGTVLKSSLKPVELTEKETEYAITAVK